MKSLARVLLVLVVSGMFAVPAMAQLSEAEIAKNQQELAVEQAKNWSRSIGAGIGAGVTIIGAAYGISLIGSRAVESMARQPEVAGSIQVAMIISAALIEGVTFFALLVCFFLV